MLALLPPDQYRSPSPSPARWAATAATRTTTSCSTSSWPGCGLQGELERLLEVLADAREELRGVGAVEDAVVAGEGELHHRAHGHLAVADHGPRLERADGEDRGLRRGVHPRGGVCAGKSGGWGGGSAPRGLGGGA